MVAENSKKFRESIILTSATVSIGTGYMGMRSPDQGEDPLFLEPGIM